MSDALYERYKDALRRGHLATQRGRHDAALAAYVEAATIAPERALPHTSIGTASLRLGHAADALNAFDSALDRSPVDERALAGRAEALVALRRSSEAAATLDALSVAQEADGRPVDALDSARWALELAESRSRRRAVERLVGHLRKVAGDAPVQAALARALHLLERTSVVPPDSEERPAVLPETDEATVALMVAADAPGPSVDPLRLIEEAESAIEAGDVDASRDGLLRAARLLDEAGYSDAALDACYEALALAPDDPDLHLVLADLYLDRGWGLLAADKVVLLGRMADLSGDVGTGERVRDLARRRMADDVRVRDLLG